MTTIGRVSRDILITSLKSIDLLSTLFLALLDIKETMSFVNIRMTLRTMSIRNTRSRTTLVEGQTGVYLLTSRQFATIVLPS